MPALTKSRDSARAQALAHPARAHFLRALPAAVLDLNKSIHQNVARVLRKWPSPPEQNYLARAPTCSQQSPTCSLSGPIWPPVHVPCMLATGLPQTANGRLRSNQTSSNASTFTTSRYSQAPLTAYHSAQRTRGDPATNPTIPSTQDTARFALLQGNHLGFHKFLRPFFIPRLGCSGCALLGLEPVV